MYLDVPFVHRKYLMEVELLLRGNPAFRKVRADVPEDSRPSGWRYSSWEEIVADVKNGSKSDCSTVLRKTHRFKMEKSLLYLTSPQSLSLLIGRIIMIGKL